MAKGRKPLVLDKAEFQKLISDLEAKTAFPTRSALWEAVENSVWAKTQSPRPLMRWTAVLQAEKLGLVIKTPKGKKGDGLANVDKAAAIRAAIAAPRKSRKVPLDVIQKVKNVFPTQYHNVIDKMGSGSMKAAIKAKCLDCCCFEKAEIRDCTIQECPLWNFRPYQNKIETYVETPPQISG